MTLGNIKNGETEVCWKLTRLSITKRNYKLIRGLANNRKILKGDGMNEQFFAVKVDC